jgi:hypothetical protein
VAYSPGPKLSPTRTTQRGNVVPVGPTNARTGWKIEVSPSFEIVAKRFKLASPMLVAKSMEGVIIALQLSAKKELETQLMHLVYNNDLPEAVTTGKISRERYLEIMKRRQGMIFKAIKMSKPVPEGVKNWSGKVYIDRNEIQGYYYARVLNFGHQGSPNMTARPFFDITVKVMKARSGILAAKGLQSARDKLKGTLVADVSAI